MEGATHVMWSSEFSASRNLDAQAVEDVRLVRLSRDAHATCVSTGPGCGVTLVGMLICFAAYHARVALGSEEGRAGPQVP